MKIKSGLKKILDIVLILAVLAAAYAIRIQPVQPCLADETSYLYASGAREVAKSQDYLQFITVLPAAEQAVVSDDGEEVAEGEEATAETVDEAALTAPAVEAPEAVVKPVDKYQSNGISILAALISRFAKIDLWKVMYFMCAAVAPLATIPAYIFVRRRTNFWGGVTAGLLTAVISAFAAHSMPGHFEPAAFVLVLGMTGMCLMGEAAFGKKLLARLVYALFGVICLAALVLFTDNYYVFYVLGFVAAGAAFIYLLIGKIKEQEGFKSYAFGGVMTIAFMACAIFMTGKFIRPLSISDIIGTMFGGSSGEMLWPEAARYLTSLQAIPLLGGGIVGIVQPNIPGVLNYLGGLFCLIACVLSLLGLVMAFIKKRGSDMSATALFAVVWLLLSILFTVFKVGSVQVLALPLIVIIGLGLGIFGDRKPREKIVKPKKEKKPKKKKEPVLDENGQPVPGKLAVLLSKIKPFARLQEKVKARAEKKRLKAEEKTKRRKVKVARWVGTVIAIVFIMGAPVYGAFAIAHEPNYVPMEYRDIAGWIDENLEWDASIITWDGYSHFLEYASGRNTVPGKDATSDEFYYMLGRAFMTDDFDDAASLCKDLSEDKEGIYMLISPEMVQNAPVLGYYGLWDIFGRVDDEELRDFGTVGPVTMHMGDRFYAPVNGIKGCEVHMVLDGTGLQVEIETVDPTITDDYKITRYIEIQDGHLVANKDEAQLKEEARLAKEAKKQQKKQQSSATGGAVQTTPKHGSNIIPQSEVEETLADYMPADAESRRNDVHAPTVGELTPEMRQMFSPQDLTGTPRKDTTPYVPKTQTSATTKAAATVEEASPEAIATTEEAVTAPAIDKRPVDKQGIDFGENPENDGLTLYVLRSGDKVSLVLCTPVLGRSILLQMIFAGQDTQNRFECIYSDGISLWKVK